MAVIVSCADTPRVAGIRAAGNEQRVCYRRRGQVVRPVGGAGSKRVKKSTLRTGMATRQAAGSALQAAGAWNARRRVKNRQKIVGDQKWHS